MNIYFTAPIKAGRAQQPEFKAIIAALGHYGTVHAPHNTEAFLSYHGETGISDKEIFERELTALNTSDVVVAEVTESGPGVGYLIARAVVAGKRVLALYRGDNTLKLSSILKGDPHITLLMYKDLTEIEAVFAAHLGEKAN